MKILSTILLFAVVCTASAVEVIDTRLSVDPALRGIWRGSAASSDEGKTWDFGVEEFARVRVSTITLGDTTYEVSQVIVFRDNNGEIGNMILFENNTSSFVVTHVKGIEGAFLIQLFTGPSGEQKETYRVIFQVIR